MKIKRKKPTLESASDDDSGNESNQKNIHNTAPMFPPGECPTQDFREDQRELFEGMNFNSLIKTVADYRLRAD